MFLYGIFMIGVFFLHMIIAVIENVVGIVLVIMGTKKITAEKRFLSHWEFLYTLYGKRPGTNSSVPGRFL